MFAWENASVAAVNKETSVENGDEDCAGSAGCSAPEVLEGISLGSSVDVIGADSPSSGLGDGGGVGMLFGLSEEFIGARSVSDDLASSEALRKLCSPFRFGTRKL